MIRSILQTLVVDACAELGFTPEKINLEYPEDFAHGDFSSNIAMTSAKSFGAIPKDLAQKIADKIKNKNSEYIKDIQVAGPGFLNFFLADSYFNHELTKACAKDAGLSSSLYKGKEILVEHSSPNLFKPFHIGHVMNNSIGESVARLAKASGASVKVISYPSDVSLGIGKAVWAMLQDGKTKWDSLASQKEQLQYFGDCYVRGTKALEDNPELLKEMQEITKNLYDKNPSPEYEVYEWAKNINLDYFKSTTASLGSIFDDYIYESEAGLEGTKIVEAHIGDVFEKSDGAVIYRGEQDGLHTRVFINKEGYPTYEAKDLGLLALKFKKYNPDISLFVTDHQQEEYFKVVAAAGGKIDKSWQDKTVHLTHGRMRFKGQKMSSRLGGVPTASEILEVVNNEILDKSDKLDGKEREAIAISALKFSILRAGLGKNINFDPETSLSFEGDSGPYLQYSAVRAKAILAKAKEMGKSISVDSSASATELTKNISRFQDCVEQSISKWEPHYIATYLLSIAQSFNSWYATGKILDENNKNMDHELALVSGTYNVLLKGLNLLGISVPEKM